MGAPEAGAWFDYKVKMLARNAHLDPFPCAANEGYGESDYVFRKFDTSPRLRPTPRAHSALFSTFVVFGILGVGALVLVVRVVIRRDKHVAKLHEDHVLLIDEIASKE